MQKYPLSLIKWMLLLMVAQEFCVTFLISSWLLGSDVDTRRHAACHLIKALCKHFEEKVIQIFNEFIQKMLSEFIFQKYYVYTIRGMIYE